VLRVLLPAGVAPAEIGVQVQRRVRVVGGMGRGGGGAREVLGLVALEWGDGIPGVLGRATVRKGQLTF
jgi:hypothetical protein